MSDTHFDPERARQELEAVAEKALADARRLGADQAEVSASQERALSVSVRMGEVETLEHHRDRGVTVAVYFGKRKGTASSGDLSGRSLDEAVQKACAIARHTQDDPCTGLANPERMADASALPELDAWHPWELAPERAIELALECENAAREEPRITNSEGASVETGAGIGCYANTHGFLGVQRGTRHDIACAVIAGEGDAMQRDFWYTVARAREDMEGAREVGRRAAARTVRRLDSRRVRTGRVPVLFAPEVARGLIGSFVAAVSGSNLYRDASFLQHRLGERVFAQGVHVVEQPHLKRALGSAVFDEEGVATGARDLVRDGVLQGYVLSSYSACKLGMESTGNAGGVHNLTLEPGERGFDELVTDMGRGLVVTEMMGQGVNIVTGDYSRGASGFWVEDGAIAYPVHEITVAGNLAQMFLAIAAVGSDVDVRGNIRTGSILLDGMTVAGE